MERQHAFRSFLQATYSPIRLDAKQKQAPRPWDGHNLIASVGPTLQEVQIARDRVVDYVREQGDVDPTPYVVALEAVGRAVAVAPNALRAASALRAADPEALAVVTSLVLDVRARSLGEAVDRIAANRLADAAPTADASPDAPEEVLGVVVRAWPRMRVLRAERHDDRTGTVTVRIAPRARALRAMVPVPVTLGALVRRAGDPGATDARALLLRELPGVDVDTLEPPQVQAAVAARLAGYLQLLEAYRQRLGVEPVGYLHLERLTFTPAATERGELLYSVPLAPAEEINISHKEWANTSQELSTIVTDYLESFSEQGVTEKNELSQSTSSQQQHSSGYNTGVTASGGFGPINITTSFGYNAQDSASRSQQSSRKESLDLTSKASSRAKREHKQSFKVASASGSEDQSVRRIRNPFSDRATRIDYYQLLRRWQVDLVRYGVRMTYDLTIPEPGVEILSRTRRVRLLEVALASEFALPVDFPASPAHVNPQNYTQLVARWGGADIEGIDDAERTLTVSDRQTWSDNHGSEMTQDFYALTAEVPPDREVLEASVSYIATTFADQAHRYRLRVFTTDNLIEGVVGRDSRDTIGNGSDGRYVAIESLVGRSGTLMVYYQATYLQDVQVSLQLTLGLKEQLVNAWRLRVWTALRDALIAADELRRQAMREELALLREQLAGSDPLSLRKIEREEMMKGVLRWLLGPSFQLSPADIPARLYRRDDESVIDDATQERVLSHGEVIKFLHHAIEWENMAYFLYPYFWSHQSRWELKKYLDHPDPLHRSFLKAGAARVVLTIRPGFEPAFLAFLTAAELGGSVLPDGVPYLSIAEEMQRYAETNFPDTPSANPDRDVRPLLTVRQRRTWERIQQVSELLERHRRASGAYPTTAQGLAALASFVDPSIPEVPTQDAWGHDLVYAQPGLYGEYDLSSPGGDSDDERGEISTWSRGSLIARWFEFTPTSALDIGFDTVLPEA